MSQRLNVEKIISIKNATRTYTKGHLCDKPQHNLNCIMENYRKGKGHYEDILDIKI